MARIKICGVRDRAAIDAAAAGRADYVGFVFFAKSPRNLSLDEAGGLAGGVPPGIRRIGLFVNADDEAIGAAVRAARLDGVQLHGDEGPDRAAAVKARFGVEVWKGTMRASPIVSCSTRRHRPTRRCPAAWACASTGGCWPALIRGRRGGWRADLTPRQSAKPSLRRRRRSSTSRRGWKMRRASSPRR